MDEYEYAGADVLEWADQTHLHPLAAAIALSLAICVILLRRERAIVPLLIAACIISMRQRLVIAGADFTVLRILVAVYLVRLVARREFLVLRWNGLDTAMVCWAVSGTLVYTIADGTVGSLVYRMGWSFDMLGIYFVGRCLICNWLHLQFVAKTLAILSIPVAAMFLYEWATEYNPFSVFGGVPAKTWVREGRVRCQGAFAHPILAGTFWAASLPTIWILWRDRPGLARVGTAGSLMVVAACGSSTPVLSVLVAVFGAFLFRWRNYRRYMWTGLFALLIFLHIVMKAPVWHLMSRVDITGGSTGWHRYIILDTFINNFSEWYLLGERDPMRWGVWQMRDTTNQYVLEGLAGGLLTLAIFVSVLVLAFAGVGRSLALISRSVRRQWFSWCVGVAILVHSVTFLGVSYFGQMVVMLYLQLAFASSVYDFSMRDAIRSRPRTRSESSSLPRRGPTTARPY